MNMTFEPNNLDKWTITDNSLLCGKKCISLKSIKRIVFDRPLDGAVFGLLSVYYGIGCMSKLTVYFPIKDTSKAEEVANYLKKFVRKEDFFDCNLEPERTKEMRLKRRNNEGHLLKGAAIFSAIFLMIILILTIVSRDNNHSSGSDKNSNGGFVGSDGKYHEYVPEFGDDVNNWMEENW